MTMTTRGIHPDLLEELTQEQSAPETATPAKSPSRRNGRRASVDQTPAEVPSTSTQELSPPSGASGTEADATDATTEGSANAPTAAEPLAAPEWLADLQGKTDPLEIIRIAREHASREDLAGDPFFQGWIGDLANKRARQMLEDQQRQAVDKQKAEAFDRGDLYALGQYAATDLQAQRQALEQQTQAALNPYMQAITAFQSTLPETVQKDVQGRTYAPGGTPAEGFQAYLQAVHESAIRHGLEEEVKKREPALRKVELSSTVGSEQSPELDGGPAQAYREITDAQVAAMTLEEYDRYFDDKGRPRPGVRVRLERGIDIRQQQR